MMVVLVLFLTVRIALSAMDHWQDWLLFRHAESLGQEVPELGTDLGYHLFRLPLLSVASSWIRELLLVALALAAFGYIVAGALRLPVNERRSAPAAVAHLALLAAALAAAQALDYVFVRRAAYGTNRAGAFDGPGYTELHVGVPSTWVLAVAALVTAFTLVEGVRSGRWRLALTVGAMWAALHVLLMTVVPAFVHNYIVEPAEADRELPHIAHNLAATRTAYRLDAVESNSTAVDDGLDAPPADGDAADLVRVPLFDTDQLVSALQVLQGTTGTRITDVDLDRYELDGTTRPVMVAARNASRADLPEHGWVQSHLVYTHGDGVVAVPADVPSNDGRPDIDAFADVTPARTELYFGEHLDEWYAIVGTKRAELGGARFDGDTGIGMSSLWRRAVLALSVGEVEPLLSAELTADSQLLYRRGVIERLESLAPFLRFDGDPYPVVTGESVVWVVDGYTTSSTYPHSQFASDAGLPASSRVPGSFNYLRASVKATVDAYDGTVHLYRTDVGGRGDPILDIWEDIFPGLVEPIGQLPDSISAHLRYPADLLTVQTNLLGRYHVEDPETLFNGTERWSVSPAASNAVGQPASGAAPAVSLFMPQDDARSGGHWVAIRPFSPGASSNPSSTRDELAAYAIADHDDPERLRLVGIDRRPGQPVATPVVAQSAIDADPDLARLFSLLNDNGSKVEFGPLTPIPLRGALVWTRPIIVSGTATTTVPRLYGVLGVSDGLVGLGDDVPEALTAAVTGAAPTAD
jgi:hypothetical protein